MTTSPAVEIVAGREIRFPVQVRDAAIATATVLAPAAGARAALAGTGLVPSTPVPGRALWTLSAIDYRDNDLGDYLEISVAVVVRPPDRSALGRIRDLATGRLATHILHLPVDQEFTCLAGRQLWGFPKDVDDLRFERADDLLTATWHKDGEHVLTLTLPVGGRRAIPESTLRTFTRMPTGTHVTDFTLGGSEGAFRGGGRVRIDLGEHPIARRLAEAGLPGRPLMAVSIDHGHGAFGAPAPVTEGLP